MKKLLPIFLSLQLITMNLFAVEEEAPSYVRDQGFGQTLVMMAIALLFFYLILWRPEQKRRKAMEEQRNSLKIGDKVLAMGIVGRVDKILDETVIVKMTDGSKIEFVKGAITEILPEISEVTKK